MTLGEATLEALAARRRVEARVMIVVAHPDDETIGMGAQLCRLGDVTLVHTTDGAPRDGEDARAYGFARPEDYAAARRAELAAALCAGTAAGVRAFGLGIPDKQSWRDLAGLTERIADLLRAERPAAVFTHAYEGGHPDHDAAAFAVSCACRFIDNPLPIVEIPLYHRGPGRLVMGQFLQPSSRRKPGSTDPRTEPLNDGSPLSPGRPLCGETIIPLSEEEIQRKRRMVACFTTQRWLLEQFDLSAERFRLAPDYDFTEPPHPGELHYETLGWGISGDDWRRAAAEALAALNLNRPKPSSRRKPGSIVQPHERRVGGSRPSPGRRV